ncbi:hypothetical protein ACWKWC_01375 [Geodermatophilus nigrescens]
MTRDTRPRTGRVDALAAHLEPAFRLLAPAGDASGADDLPRRLARVLEQRPADVDALYDRYLGTPPHDAEAGQQPPAEPSTVHWVREHVWNAPGSVFLVVTGLATASYVAFRTHPLWQVPAAQAFAVLLLGLLPGFLYLRFIRFRIGPLCDEYVQVLHRLGVDEPRFLPEPSRSSAAWRRWYESGGPGYRCRPSSYQSRFVGQYGRWPASDDDLHRDTLSRLASVYLCVATLTVCWAFVVWSAPVADTLPRSVDALRAGFLGAYFFLLSLLIRRYFQNDLRPGAYLAGVVRVVTVLVLVAGIDQVFALSGAAAGGPDPLENVVAFAVGVFPTVGIQLLRRVAGKLTGPFRGGLEPPFPLSQLDGMDIWSESRLAEVGIEDVQHLATADLGDVALVARIPMQRIVDWVDQSLLLLRTGRPRIDNLDDPCTTYAGLRALGVRSSTDLLELVDALRLDLRPGGCWPGPDSPVASLALPTGCRPGPEGATAADGTPELSLLTRMALAAVTLRNEPNLRLLVNWHRTAPEGQPPVGLPATHRRRPGEPQVPPLVGADEAPVTPR